MAQLAIYVDDKTAREIKKACRRSGLSRSEWASAVIKRELHGGLPEEFFRVIGTWEDARSPQEIFKDIRSRSAQRKRPLLR